MLSSVITPGLRIDPSKARTRRYNRSFIALGVAFLAIPTFLLAEPLEVLAEDEAPPWSYNDGTGFANEVVQAAFKASGVDAVLRVMPYARCKEMTLTGNAAACFSMAWVPEFQGKIVFSDKPLFDCYVDFFCRADAPLVPNTEAEITRKMRVGVVVGYEYPPSLQRLQERGLVELESARSEELNLKKLAFGRLDATLLNYNDIKSAEFMVARAGLDAKFSPAFRCGVSSLFIGFSANHPRGPWAREKFNQGYSLIEANGTLEEIRSRWISRVKQDTRDMLHRSQVRGGAGTSLSTGGSKP